MTETIAPRQAQAEPPRIIPRPATDGAAVCGQDCVNKILATVEQDPGAGQPAAG
jgi:hypothetical protein